MLQGVYKIFNFGIMGVVVINNHNQKILIIFLIDDLGNYNFSNDV